MKTTLISSLFMLVFVIASHGQGVISPCLTMEQAQAKYNQDLANKVVVKDTASQQLQTYYQQLATYWQQKDKDNQQKAKDLQQIAKDKQQMDKDAQQIATDKVLSEKAAVLSATQARYGYDELLVFIETILPYVGDCSLTLRNELKAIHYNRSGQMDGTNPGGQTHNINGFDNPAWTIISNK